MALFPWGIGIGWVPLNSPYIHPEVFEKPGIDSKHQKLEGKLELGETISDLLVGNETTQ